MKESIEEKIRKIQGLFADQVEIRIGTDTESEEGFPTHKIWWCDLVYVDDDYKDHKLSFVAEAQTMLYENLSAAGADFATETTLEETLDGFYEECIKYIKRQYVVYTDDLDEITIAVSPSAVSPVMQPSAGAALV